MKRSTMFTIPLSILTFSAVAMWGYTLYNEITDGGQARKHGVLIDDKTVSSVYGFDERFFEFTIGTQTKASTDTQQPSGQTGFVQSGSGQPITAQSPPVQPVSAQQALLTQQAIQARYTPAFAQLQQELDSRIAQMKDAASVDYKSCKQKGSPSIPELVMKYTTVGHKLQEGADKAFYTMLAQMKRDLYTAGLTMDIANRAELEYKAQLQRKKTELIMKGKSKL